MYVRVRTFQPGCENGLTVVFLLPLIASFIRVANFQTMNYILSERIASYINATYLAVDIKAPSLWPANCARYTFYVCLRVYRKSEQVIVSTYAYVLVKKMVLLPPPFLTLMSHCDSFC